MLKLFLKNLIYLSLINSADIFTNNLLPIKAKSNNRERIINLRSKKNFDKNTSIFVNPSLKYNFLKVFKEDILSSDNQIINIFIASNLEDKSDFLMDIESDTQYQSEGVFNAEGNAILYFSNAKLLADKITYDRENKIMTAEGNIKFYKGEQYFEASNLLYNLETNTGYVDNIYGVLNITTLNNDLDLKNLPDNEKIIFNDKGNNLEDLQYINTANIGLVNDFEENKKFNISDVDLKIPKIPRWRFKTKKLNLESKKLKSDLIFFTNDPINKPQFILESRKFTAQIVDDKSQLISRNTWVILDNKIKFPIGRRNIIDRDPLTKWGIGRDYGDKDGYYIIRGFESIKFSENFSLKMQPYFLIQRANKGLTKVFREDNSSIFSPKIERATYLLDYVAIDIGLSGKLDTWDLSWKAYLNSLDPNKLSQSLETKVTLRRTFDLNPKDTEDILVSEEDEEDLSNLRNFDDLNSNDSKDEFLFKDKEEVNSFGDFTNLNSNDSEDEFLFIDKEEVNSFGNFIDLQLYSSFRETVSRGYEGEAEIYFGNGMSIANRREWNFDGIQTSLAFIYDLGQFNAKSRTANELRNLTRNVFAVKLNNKVPIWKKDIINKSINESYKYTPGVINEEFNWRSGIQAGTFYYSNGDNQNGIILNTGPELVIGSLKKDFFDYTKIGLMASKGFKNGHSPYAFDGIGSSARLQLDFEQQIIGPLIFSYENSMDLSSGEFSKPNYSLDLKRRAYSVGAYYNVSKKSVGIKLNIFNFNYSGVNKSF